MIEKAIYYRLSHASTVTALTSTRIYNLELPQETTMPAIVFSRINTNRDLISHGGALGLAESIIQVSLYADTVPEVRALSEAVRKTLHVYKGTNNGVEILLSRLINEVDLFDSELEVYHVAMDFQVKFREATA